MPIRMKIGGRTYRTHKSAAKKISKKKGWTMQHAYQYVQGTQNIIKRRRAAKRSNKRGGRKKKR